VRICNRTRAIYNATGDKAYTGVERAALICGFTGKPVGFATVPADVMRAAKADAGP
jgi:uncharacterized protein YbjT (DUF2867 family)